MQKEYIYVIITGILSGVIVFGGQVFSDMGLSLFQIVLFPSLFSLILLPFVLKKERRPTKSMIKILAVFGFFGALGNLSQFGAIILGVPVAVTVLLLYTQPLWTVIFSKIFLHEEITNRKIISMIVVLLGLLIVVNPFSISSVGNITGLVVALFGGLMLSSWVIFGRISGKKNIHPVTTQFCATAFMILFLGLSFLILKNFIQTPKIMDLSFNLPIIVWGYIFLFELFVRIIAHILYYTGMKKVTASTAGIILLLEPVSAIILAAIFLGQPITGNVIIGGLLILLSNYIVLS